jgi:hypothetical protein
MSRPPHLGETFSTTDPPGTEYVSPADSTGTDEAHDNPEETRPRTVFNIAGSGPAGGFESHPVGPPHPIPPLTPLPGNGSGGDSTTDASGFSEPTTSAFGDPSLQAGRSAPPLGGIGADGFGPPTGFLGPPTEHVGPPIEYAGPPTEHVGPPIEYAGPPTEHVGPPIEYAGPPTEYVPQPGFPPPGGFGPPPGAFNEAPNGGFGPPPASFNPRLEGFNGPPPVPPAGAPPLPPSGVGLRRSPTDAPRGAAARPSGPPPGSVRARGPRRARLQLRHVNPWTVLKFSCVLSIALFFVWLITIGLLYGILQAAGVIDHINSAVTTINGSASKDPVTPGLVFGGAAIIGVVNIVLFIALSTVGSVVYNLCADLVGGVEVTLSERD